jgi:hypothetical protein
MRICSTERFWPTLLPDGIDTSNVLGLGEECAGGHVGPSVLVLGALEAGGEALDAGNGRNYGGE